MPHTVKMDKNMFTRLQHRDITWYGTKCDISGVLRLLQFTIYVKRQRHNYQGDVSLPLKKRSYFATITILCQIWKKANWFVYEWMCVKAESWRIVDFSSRCDMLSTLASTSSSLACLAHLFTSSLSSVTGSQDRETFNAKINSIFPFHCQLFLRKSVSLGPSPDLRLPGSPNGSLRKKMLIPFSFPKTKLSHQYAPSSQQG